MLRSGGGGGLHHDAMPLTCLPVCLPMREEWTSRRLPSPASARADFVFVVLFAPFASRRHARALGKRKPAPRGWALGLAGFTRRLVRSVAGLCTFPIDQGR